MQMVESCGKADETFEEQQAELIKLQRQFRLLEDDRRAYKEEAEHTLSRQKETINNLMTEQDELKKDRKLAGSFKNRTSDAANTEKLRRLLREEEEVMKAIQDEDATRRMTDTEIKELQAETDSLRKSMGGGKESERRCKMSQKLNRVMENRLNQANIRFNTALAQNLHMRQEIDHINIQRSRFEDIHKKLSRAFERGRAEKDSLIDQATALFNSRDEAVHRMQSLRERSERDMTQYNAELKDLLRIIDHDRTLREFMNTKTEERGEMYEAAVQGRRDKKLLDYIKGLENEVGHYENIFVELKKVSGLDDIDEMVKKFIEIEDQNFAAFNFVKEQSVRMQQYETTIGHYKQEIAALGRDEVRLQKEHKHIMRELEAKQAQGNEETEKINKIWKLEKKLLERIIPAVDKLFNKIKCDRALMAELLGGATVNDENLVQYLGLIEQKANEMLQARAMALAKGETVPQEDSTPLFSFAAISKVARLCIAAPTLNTDVTETSSPSSNSQESIRPFTREDARIAVTMQPMDAADVKKAVRQA